MRYACTGFALIERGRPAERGQPLSAVVFNIEYLFIYQLINFLLLPVLTALAVERLRAAFPGAFGLIKVEGFLDGAWKTVAFLFVYDFFYYWFHRLQHGSPFLWAQHKLHHSEVALNATVVHRVDPKTLASSILQAMQNAQRDAKKLVERLREYHLGRAEGR